MKKCSKCGNKSEYGDFCPNCGGPLIAISSTSKTSSLRINMGRTSTGTAKAPKSSAMISETKGLSTSDSSLKGSRLKGSMGGERVSPTTATPPKTPTKRGETPLAPGRKFGTKRIDESDSYYHIGEDGHIQFKRAPRLIHELPDGEIEIASPPTAMGKPEINWLATFLPTIVTIGIALVMATVMGNPMMMLYTLPMTVAGVIVSITNYRKQTKKYNEQVKTRKEKYEKHLDDAVQQIEEKRDEQITAMLLSDPATEECLSIVKNCQARLWERRPSDADFLHVRIGSGSVDFSVKITIPKEGLSLEEDELKARPKAIYEKYHEVESAPIICNILDEQICGVVGRSQDNKAVIKNIILQLTTHHSYSEFKAVCIYDPSDENEIKWIKELPHFGNESRTTVYTASSKIETTELLKSFSEILKQRKLMASAEDSYGKSPIYLPYILFIVLQPAFLEKSNPINEYLFMTRGLGVGVIMSVEDLAQLPKECNELIVMKGKTGELFNKNRASDRKRFTIDPVTGTSYTAFGHCIKTIYCDEGSVRETLPKSYSFFEMLGISGVNELDIEKRWSASNVIKSLAAPLGIMESGGILALDLHEDAHGPHGLVAGTTGSGKSELLQSCVLSMALKFHPYEVGFLIIDFKGGGMVNQFSKLPHLIGAITNIEGDEITRSLASIKAELLKRQRLFADSGVNSIDKYIEKYKAHRVEVPLPHLIIIVDEFAELKAEQPEFMAELISTARIGRSLGVHLILATQKPAGQVNEQIWSNVKFEICLKVASGADSKEVIKSDLAAKIIEPGRAYLRVGNNEVFELFQSGYSGGKLEGSDSTQLEVTIDHINQYCVNNNITPIPSVCLPVLPKALPYKKTVKSNSGIRVEIGHYDDPDNQQQAPYELNLLNENVAIVGSAQTGKTNLLQTIIKGLVEQYSPEEVTLYIVDFNSMILKNFESLKHVGGVVTTGDDEAIKNLFKLILALMSTRKEKLLQIGVSSYASYIEAGYKDMPKIVLIIDNILAFKDIYPQENDLLFNICQNGSMVGISVVITSAQTSGIGYKLLSNFSTKIAFFCNDSSEYSVLFDYSRRRIANIPGRCLVSKDKAILQCQIYLPFKGEREIERVHGMRKLSDELNEKYRDYSCVIKIPVIPKVLTKQFVDSIATWPRENYHVGIGLDYSTIDPVILDLLDIGLLGISGKNRGDRKNFIRYLLNELNNTRETAPVSVCIIDSFEKQYDDLSTLEIVGTYSILAEDVLGIIQNWDRVLSDRYHAIASGNIDSLEQESLLLLIINNNDVAKLISEDKSTLLMYKNYLGRYKSLKVCVIFSDMENVPIPYAAPEAIKPLKDSHHFIFFDNLESLKLFEPSSQALRQNRKDIEVGDCYYIKSNNYQRVKTVLLQ